MARPGSAALTLPALRAGPLPLPQCERGAARAVSLMYCARRDRSVGDAGLALLLLPHDVTPHLVALGLKIGLRDDEAGVEQQLGRLLAGPHVLKGLECHVDLEEQVLHAAGVEITVLQPLIGALVAVEPAE